MDTKMAHIALQVTVFTTLILFQTLPISVFAQPPAGLDPALAEAEKAPKIVKVPGDFKTVTEAVNSVPDKNTVRTIIQIAPGTYKEKVTITREKHFITLLGTDPVNKPVITFDGTALKYGTVASATVAIESDYCVAANIVFENTAPEPDGKMKLAQAVAFRVSGEKAAFYNCRILGFQDTLCDDKGTHFFSNCYIEGTVDFIFGRGKSLYMDTELHSRSTGTKLTAITAHAREKPDDDSGYAFVNCKITGEGDIWLGRAWKEMARVVFINTEMPQAVNPEAWSPMDTKQNIMEFGEFKNTGPGAAVTKRPPFAKQMTEEQAKPYLDKSYINASTWLLPAPKV